MKKKIYLRNIRYYNNYIKLIIENKKIIKSIKNKNKFTWSDAKEQVNSYNGKLYGIYQSKILVGTIGVGNIDLKNKICSIGIMILKKYQSKGIGYVALSKVTKLIFTKGFKEIFLGVEQNNHRAIKLYSKLNFIKKKKINKFYTMTLSNDKKYIRKVK